jgi:hypothetical protein
VRIFVQYARKKIARKQQSYASIVWSMYKLEAFSLLRLKMDLSKSQYEQAELGRSRRTWSKQAFPSLCGLSF